MSKRITFKPFNKSGRTRAEIIASAESTWLKPYLLKADILNYVGSMDGEHFYHVEIAGSQFNNDVLSLSYLQELGLVIQN